MSLLDQNFTNCSIKWQGKKPTSKINAIIENFQGEKIGSIISEGSIKRHVGLFNLENSRILSSFSSVMRSKFEIKDSTDTLLGNGKEKLGWRDSHLIVEDLDEKEILKVLNLSKLAVVHNVQNPNKETVASFEIKKMEDNYTCDFQIIDQTYDKKILWGSFLAMLSSFYNGTDSHPIGA